MLGLLLELRILRRRGGRGPGEGTHLVLKLEPGAVDAPHLPAWIERLDDFFRPHGQAFHVQAEPHADAGALT